MRQAFAHDCGCCCVATVVNCVGLGIKHHVYWVKHRPDLEGGTTERTDGDDVEAQKLMAMTFNFRCFWREWKDTLLMADTNTNILP